MVSIFKSPFRMLRTLWHKVLGRLYFRLGRTEPARRHFERVLVLRGDDFTAYLYLSRLAYGAGDYAGWRRELEHARRTSPERYALLRYPFELFEPLAAGAILEEAGERATWRAIHLSPVGSGGDDFRLGERSLTSCPGDGLRRYGDDFSSDQERQKFIQLPPIRPEDVESVDMDQLLRRL